MDRYIIIYAGNEKRLQEKINKQAEQGYRLLSITAYADKPHGLASGSAVSLVAAMEKEPVIESGMRSKPPDIPPPEPAPRLPQDPVRGGMK